MKKKLSKGDRVLNTLLIVGAVNIALGMGFNIAGLGRVWYVMGTIGAVCFGLIVVVGFINMVKNEWL